MSKIQFAYLALITVGGPGVIFVLSGLIINMITKRKIRLCTEQTEGIVVKHRFLGEGNMYPIVEYFVDGICYKAKKKFRGVFTKRISGLPLKIKSSAFEDEKGWLHVKIGPVANLRQLAEQLWPINSKMTVYYNPNNPKKCYVDRPIAENVFAVIFVLTGILMIIISIFVFFLIQ